jgi:hypothetical protein
MKSRRTTAPLYAAALILSASTPAAAGMLDRQVLDEINYARVHPAAYARDLLQSRGEDGQYGRRDPGPLDEAVDFLERQRPLPPLTADQSLEMAAADLVVAQGPRGLTGHAGGGGSSPSERLHRRGVSRSLSAEAISYGYGTAAGVVRQLIIDEGVSNRGHRMTIFDPNLQIAGADCGMHALYRYMCVIDFAGSPIGR